VTVAEEVSWKIGKSFRPDTWLNSPYCKAGPETEGESSLLIFLYVNRIVDWD